MAFMGLCGPQQARSWLKASYDVSIGSEGPEHLGSQAGSHPDSSCLKGEKCMSTCISARGYFLLSLGSGLYTADILLLFFEDTCCEMCLYLA